MLLYSRQVFNIDLISKNQKKLTSIVSLMTYSYYLLLTRPMTVAFDEVNVNYISLFTLIKFFLPHLLKLGVSLWHLLSSSDYRYISLYM